MIVAAVLIGAFFAVICHAVTTRFWVAVSVSAALTLILFWGFTQSHFGWFDWTFVENVAITLVIAVLVSVVVGRLFMLIRTSKARPDS